MASREWGWKLQRKHELATLLPYVATNFHFDHAVHVPMLTSDPYNILIPIRLEDVDSIWIALRNHRFEFAERTYAHFTAMRNGLHVSGQNRAVR